LNVNESSHPDLYFALRGGGNNFGIATRFDLDTFAQGDIWGGAIVTPITTNVTLLNALVDLAVKSPQNPDAFAWLAFAYVASYEMYIVSTELVNAKPVPNPPILNNFITGGNLSSTLQVRNVSDLARELNQSNPDGLRESYWYVRS
jgi:hypothetical protein